MWPRFGWKYTPDNRKPESSRHMKWHTMLLKREVFPHQSDGCLFIYLLNFITTSIQLLVHAGTGYSRLMTINCLLRQSPFCKGWDYFHNSSLNEIRIHSSTKWEADNLNLQPRDIYVYSIGIILFYRRMWEHFVIIIIKVLCQMVWATMHLHTLQLPTAFIRSRADTFPCQDTTMPMMSFHCLPLFFIPPLLFIFTFFCFSLIRKWRENYDCLWYSRWVLFVS